MCAATLCSNTIGEGGVSWGRILGPNWGKTLKSFPPGYAESSLQLCLEISISSNSQTVNTSVLKEWEHRRNKEAHHDDLLRIVSHESNFPPKPQCMSVHSTSFSTDWGCEYYSSFPMVYKILTETSSLRTLKIIPRNLNEIVRSWIRLLYSLSVRRVIKRVKRIVFFELLHRNLITGCWLPLPFL